MNKFNFIIDDFTKVAELKATSAVFSIIINNSKDIEKINLVQLYQQGKFESESIRLSIYFNFHNHTFLDAVQIENILTAKGIFLQLFFHPRFEINANKPVLFFSQTLKNNMVVQSLISALNTYSISQDLKGWMLFI